MAELSVKLRGDIKALQKDLKKAEKDLMHTGEVAEKANKDIEKSFKRGASGVNTFGKSTANATPTLIEFNRIVQDAPYGIRGVANNIEQAATSFTYLRKSAGGTIPALKALAGSFIGPAGVLFAISAISSILVTYGDELFKSKKATNELAEATKEYLSEAKGEINTLNILLGVARNENASKEARERALKRINKEYEGYLGKLTLENINTKKVTEKVNELTNALIRQAKVRGLEDLITEKTTESAGELLELELKRAEALKEVKNQIDNLRKSTSFFREGIDPNGSTAEQLKQIQNLTKGQQFAQTRLLSSAITTYKGIQKEISEVSKEADKALDPLLRLQSAIIGQDLSSAGGGIEDAEKPKKPKKPKDFSNFLRSLSDELFKLEEAAKLEDAQENLTFANQVFKATGAEALYLAEILKNNQIEWEEFLKVQEFAKKEKELRDLLKNFSDESNNIITGSITNTFSQLGEAIGTALAEGKNVFAAIGQTILAGLGQFLSEMGGLLIKYGTLAVAKGVLDKAIAAGGPLAIGAGIAAIGVGIALKAAGSAIGKSASNGFSGSSSGAVAGQGTTAGISGGSTSTGFNGSSTSLENVVFEIAGTTIIGVIKRTLDRNKRLGGNDFIVS